MKSTYKQKRKEAHFICKNMKKQQLENIMRESEKEYEREKIQPLYQ